MLYQIFLSLHNVLRWALVAVALWALFRALTGWLGKGGWLPADAKASKLYPIFLDIQTVVGLALYAGISPLMKVAYSNIPAAMANKELRFYLVEHIAAIVIALALAHVGKVRAMRIKDSVARHKTLFFWYGASFLMVLSRIPWNRPLFPGLN
jgi:predicted lysophospholipase L1 biosynthesis ABC-type transport system permease subunit